MRSHIRVPLSAVLLLLLASCATRAQVGYEPAFPTLSFDRPVDLQHAGDGTSRLFVVEQQGIIRVFDPSSSAPSANVFLDIRGRVNDSGNEEGLLGLAFHPNFEQNGFFYVNYTANPPRRTMISRFKVSAADPNRADSSSESLVLMFPQPYSNHNGGALAFGPDGYLYIATGDGGSGGDPQGNGQNRKTLLGKFLRIDVNSQSPGLVYGIPADNPFVGNTEGYREEIYAWGMRNPWRFSFDPETGRMWTGDVGQGKFEEIDIIEKGKNYGWNIMEGSVCYQPASGCDTTGLTLPVVSYGRTLGVSVTGGHVYRGTGVPSLVGKYIYADFGTGRIWTLSYTPGSAVTNTELLNTGKNISTFGVDRNNELYFCAFDGKIYRFTSGPTSVSPREASSDRITLEAPAPQPASAASVLYQTLRLEKDSDVRLFIADALGREVVRVFEGRLVSGQHRFVLPAAGLRPGTYFSTLERGEQRLAQPLLLLR
ncbi:MAG: PQQ-dependent sugar dehydrogenase [Ignavibacteriae bacterium]|nr:PQQ-dependent sugar dehydrogenase [Ignavibacteriota bacterium]